MTVQHRYPAYFDVLFQEYLGEIGQLGFGVGVLFFPPLVFFAILEDVLLAYRVPLSVDLTMVWAIIALPPALSLDGFLWFGDATEALRQILIEDPRPLAEWLENLFPLLFLLFGEFIRRCFRWPPRLRA
ncbi:hypothetical protein F4818DRAFT_304519 [Hypoxylon cercidicola]|nr:hypothetical protein F4818DRAFT_304519 [Hypoxylon cercidicola]